MQKETHAFRLELESGTDPIRGRLADVSGPSSIDFVGWLGLASALERALETIGPVAAETTKEEL
jgi:hypothetical protein